MSQSDYLYKEFRANLKYEPTECQETLLKDLAVFMSDDEGDIFVVNGYAGTGKTTAISAIIKTLRSLRIKCVLMAPTGRSAKILSSYSNYPAHTVHKTIYKQKSVNSEGMGQFSLAPNKAKDTLFVVDEVSLVNVDTSQSKYLEFGSGNLLADMISFVRAGNNCKLIMLGDSAQLPPVGLNESPALSMAHMKSYGGVRYAELRTVVRQQEESGILHNATKLRNTINDVIEKFANPSIQLSIKPFKDIEKINGGDLIETIGEAYDKYGEEETIILCRSNKRAIRYNKGIRATVQFKEERLLKGDRLMIVKNCYQFLEDVEDLDYIANGDMAILHKIDKYEDRYGLHFARARLSFPDYNDQEIVAKVCLDTLESESAALSPEQQNLLFTGVSEDYAHITSKKNRYEAVREDHYYNALQLKYANAITCHKSQGGQWKCVFIDCPFWQDEQNLDDLKWLYTALTRAVEKVYLVNFNDRFFV